MEKCHVCTKEYLVGIGNEKLWKILQECSHKCCTRCFYRLKMKQWAFYESPQNDSDPIEVLRTKCPICGEWGSCLPESEVSNPSAKIKTLIELAKALLSQPHHQYGDLNASCGVDITYQKVYSEAGFKIIDVIHQGFTLEWHVEQLQGESVMEFIEREKFINDDPSTPDPEYIQMMEFVRSIFPE